MPKTLTQHFFLHGKWMGQGLRSPDTLHEKLWGFYKTDGVAYFCPICNEVWFLAPIEGRETEVLRVHCEKHPEVPWGMPGVIWAPHRTEDMLEALPPSLLSRDFLLRLKYKDRV